MYEQHSITIIKSNPHRHIIRFYLKMSLIILYKLYFKKFKVPHTTISYFGRGIRCDVPMIYHKFVSNI